MVFENKLTRGFGKREHHPVWFAGGNNQTQNRLLAPMHHQQRRAAGCSPHFPAAFRYRRGWRGPREGISIHWLPFINISGRFFPRAVQSCHGKPGRGVYHAEVQAGEAGSSQWPWLSKSCWLLALTKPQVGHEGLLLGPAHPAAGGSLD